MTRFTIFFLIIFFACGSLFSQDSKNYILEINGDTLYVSLGESKKYQLKNGEIIDIKFSKKETLTYQKGPVKFNYPSSYSVTSKMIDEDVEQLLLISAAGHGIMIQIYNSINPSSIVDFMLSQIIEDDISAGYKAEKETKRREIKNGVVLNGKKATLTLDKEVEEFLVLAYGKGKKGVTVVEIKNGELEEDDQKLFDIFWSSFQIKYE